MALVVPKKFSILFQCINCQSRFICLPSRVSDNKFSVFAYLNHRTQGSALQRTRHGVQCRSFLDFPGSDKADKTKEYSGRKLVGYSMEQMYNVVSDVENYKTFVPFCKRSVVNIRKAGFLKADLIIGFPPIVESYTSNVTLIKPSLVKAECTDGKLFNHLLTSWQFTPGLKSVNQSCVIDFFVSFEFRSHLHSQLAHLFFNELVRQMEKAFFEEATQRYGKPAIQTKQLPPMPANSSQ